jgi:hypothetical protein
MRWSEFAGMCPELAEIGRRRLEERHLCLIGTLRADGLPRISPVEPYLVAEDLMIGMMAGSRKAADLLRDPRLVVHSTVTRWEADEGDFKLYGTASALHDPAERHGLYEAIAAAHQWPEPEPDDPAYHVFRIDPATVGYVCFNGSSWQDWSWNPQRGGLRKRDHPAN